MPQAFVTNLSDNTRQQMIGLLNDRLADAIHLKLAVKQAHWNIKGPGFIGIHELLDDVADRLEEGIDTIAERCVILGGNAEGTLAAVSSNSTLEPYPIDAQDQHMHVAALRDRYMALGGKLREAIDAAGDAGDEDTADLFTEISRFVDKDAWFIGAHNADVPSNEGTSSVS